jgi:hypothetical protein
MARNKQVKTLYLTVRFQRRHRDRKMPGDGGPGREARDN